MFQPLEHPLVTDVDEQYRSAEKELAASCQRKGPETMRLIPPELFRQRAEDGVAEVVVAEPEWHCDSGREAIIGCPVGAISEESR